MVAGSHLNRHNRPRKGDALLAMLKQVKVDTKILYKNKIWCVCQDQSLIGEAFQPEHEIAGFPFNPSGRWQLWDGKPTLTVSDDTVVQLVKLLYQPMTHFEAKAWLQ